MCYISLFIYLQGIHDNACKAAGCKVVWGYGNQLFVTAGSRKPFRGTSLLIFYLFQGLFTAQRVCIVRTMPWQDVRHTPVLCLNDYTYPRSFFTVG